MEERKMQASNIDEQGNVLFLDQERLERKVVGFPRRKNHPNGLGIHNFIKQKILAMRKSRWQWALRLYRMFIRLSVWMKEGGWKGELFKRGIMIAPNMEMHTSTVVLPLEVDVPDHMNEKVIVPMDLVKEALKKANFIAGMDVCLCRDANDCHDYPHDVCCLFLGEASRTVVKHNLGREFTYEEACARVDKAAEHGLMAQSVWIEVEQLLWGVRNDEMDKFLEICFCCPCCCIALRLARNAQPEDRIRFHPSGWTAVPDRTKCIGCGKCVNTSNGCPMEAISIGEDGKVVINQELCVGCGICKNRCPMDVIKLKQTMPMRDSLADYFDIEYNLPLDVWKVE
ncbi:MAG: 4Fe-4S binding protein [Oscillospiraceae bacterium]|nr:4Fe-4S binding protein [Oscillospiraceae bacterium]